MAYSNRKMADKIGSWRAVDYTTQMMVSQGRLISLSILSHHNTYWLRPMLWMYINLRMGVLIGSLKIVDSIIGK